MQAKQSGLFPRPRIVPQPRPMLSRGATTTGPDAPAPPNYLSKLGGGVLPGVGVGGVLAGGLAGRRGGGGSGRGSGGRPAGGGRGVRVKVTELVGPVLVYNPF